MLAELHGIPSDKAAELGLVAAYPVSIAEFAMVSGVEEYVLMAKKALEVESDTVRGDH